MSDVRAFKRIYIGGTDMYVNLTEKEIELLIKTINLADAQIDKYSKGEDEEKLKRYKEKRVELRMLMYKLNVYI